MHKHIGITLKVNRLFKGLDGKATTKKTAEVQKTNNKKETLFLLPEGFRYRYDSRGNQINNNSDRTDGGNGFTRKELESMQFDGRSLNWLRRSDGTKTLDGYFGDEKNWLMETVDLSPYTEPVTYESSYINQCASQVESLQKDVADYISHLDKHIESLGKDIKRHLWVPDDFASAASASLNETKAETETLARRADDIRKGFEGLKRKS